MSNLSIEYSICAPHQDPRLANSSASFIKELLPPLCQVRQNCSVMWRGVVCCVVLCCLTQIHVGGVVLANDVDKKRCYMLAHQLSKMNSPCFLVANSAAQGFPLIKLVPQSDATSLPQGMQRKLLSTTPTHNNHNNHYR